MRVGTTVTIHLQQALTSLQCGRVLRIRLAASTDEANGHCTTTVDPEAVDPEAVNLMVTFIYSGEYALPPIDLVKEEASSDDPWRASPPAPIDDREIVMHAKLYALGLRFGIVALKEYAEEKFAAAASHAWGRPSFIAAMKILPAQQTWHRDICSTIWTIVIHAISNHGSVLQHQDGLVEGILSIEGLAQELLKRKREWVEDYSHRLDTLDKVFLDAQAHALTDASVEKKYQAQRWTLELGHRVARQAAAPFEEAFGIEVDDCAAA